ncbi:MAG: Rne/Rng family ribonuclease [bacterium]|nr:Rne/Rng family ribonuclease [bacterium]
MTHDSLPFDSERDSNKDSFHDLPDRGPTSAGSDGSSGDAPSLGFGAGVGGGGTTTSRPTRKKSSKRKRSKKSTDAEAPTGRASGGGRDGGDDRGSDDGDSGEDGKGPRRKRSRRSKKASRASSSRASEDAAEDTATDEEPKPKKKRSRRKKKAATFEATSEATAEAGSSDDGVDASSDEETSGGRASTARKAKSRSSRKKSKATRASSDDAPDKSAKDDGSADDEAPKRRRRGSRGGRRRKKGATQAAAIDAIPGEDDELPDFVAPADDEDKKSSKSSKKRKRKSRSKADAEKDDQGSKKRSRKKKSTSDEPATAQEKVERDQVILINAVDPEEKRVAVVSETRIVDFMMNSDSQKTLVNDIYRGKVVNLEPAIGAAFVDFGQGRNGFLHTSDVLEMYGEKGFRLDQLLTTPVDHDIDDDSELAVDDEDEGEETGKSTKKRGRSSQRPKRRARKRMPITDLIRVGDPVVVQITKDAIGDKGPTLTTYISIPGRYLVLMPSMARTGVSRKIPDDKERRRLKRILTSLKAPEDMGVIVRTAGVGKTKTELQRDLDYLLGVWESFGKRLKSGRGPMPLYQESDVATRTLRDLFNTRTQAVCCDDPIVYDSLVEFAEKVMPEHVDRIEKHEGDRPIFHHYGIEQDFEKIFARRVELPSGGSIVFDQAEALVAIDVNSGRTRTDSFDFEEIALKTNLEAVPEIARQIRLRDLGGILVCDFIDMMKSSSNRSVERALRTELATDRARSKLGRISQFGLLEMTRQRLGPGTYKKVYQSCPRCRGTGNIRTVESRAQAILRRLGSALTQKGFTAVEARAHPEVIAYLKNRLHDYLRALEHRFEKELRLVEVPDQPEDSVLRYLRADGREVRPGGRRKR